MIKTESEVKQLFSPYHTPFANCIADAITHYYTEIAPAYSAPQKRMRATCITNKITLNVIAILPELPDVRLMEDPDRYERALLNINDIFVVRFKKLSDKFLGRNAPTQLSLQLGSQQEQFWFPDTEITNLTVGYVLDPSTGDFQIYVTCPDGGHVRWKYEIHANCQETEIGSDLTEPLFESPFKLRKSEAVDKRENINH